MKRRARATAEHDTWDLHCERYVGHNDVPRGVDVYEQRCIICHPYTDAEADALLRRGL